MKTIRVVLVDDHKVVIDGLEATFMAQSNDIEVVGKAYNETEALKVIKETRPDVVVLDLQLDSSIQKGLNLIPKIKRKHRHTNILVLTGYPDPVNVSKAIQQGANGFLTKETSGLDTIQAIREVHHGGAVLPPNLAIQALRAPKPINPGLTEREMEVMKLIGAGCTPKEIALRLHTSDSTVRKQIASIQKKIKAKTQTQIAIYAIHHGLTDDITC